MRLDRLVRMTQVHGADVAWTGDVAEGEIPVADALLTDQPGVGVLVRVADCTPIVLVGRDEPLAGVVHCGREGLVRGVVPAAVEALRARASPSIEAWIGPRACGRCYEVPETMADAVAKAVPGGTLDDVVGHPGDRHRRRRGDASSAAGRTRQRPRRPGVHDRRDEWFTPTAARAQDSGRFGAVAVIR